MKSIRTILENPPQKEVDCPDCGGSGIVNLRGMHSSDKCEKCYTGGVGRYYSGEGVIAVDDIDEWEKQMKARFKYELKKVGNV